MKNRFLHKILAVLLLGVFTFNTTPREFIHQFLDHEDTKDVITHHDSATFSEKHKHCGFLQIEPEPYQHASTHFTFQVQSMIWFYDIPVIPAPRHSDHRLLSPRAPPANTPA